MKYRFVALFLIFFVTACSSKKVYFKPTGEYLPSAKLNEYYSSVILANYQDSGNRFRFNDNNSSIKITPKDSGFYSEPNFENCTKIDETERCGYHDFFLIKGLPRKRGEFHVEVMARTRPNMLAKSERIYKIYIIKVE